MGELDNVQIIDRTWATVLGVKKLWSEISTSLNSALKGNWVDQDYRVAGVRSAELKELIERLPSIGGQRLQFVVPEYGELSGWSRSAHDIDDADAIQEVYEAVTKQEVEISTYERLLQRERRRFVKIRVQEIDANMRISLDQILTEHNGREEWAKISESALYPVTQLVGELTGLVGDSVRFPGAWADLMRHLRFREIHDIRNILQRDWPQMIKSVTEQLEAGEPLDLREVDLAQLACPPSRAVSVSDELHWDRLDAASFERLCADLLSHLPSWENVKWLTNTYASDRGRDLEAYVVVQHPLHGTTRERVLVQCKHYPHGSIAVRDVEDLPNLVHTHGRVDTYLIITSGKCTDQVTLLLDRWNERNKPPKFELWEQFRLENELGRVPGITEKYGLK